MQFSATILLLIGNAVLGLAMPTENAAKEQLEKRCIPSGGDCTNRYTDCCSQQCSISRDGTGFCF
jgi:hypothetical protein